MKRTGNVHPHVSNKERETHCISKHLLINKQFCKFEKMNALFQKTKEDPQVLVNELLLLHKSLKSRLFKPNGQVKQLEEIDFGCKFVQESSKRLTAEDRMGIQVRCKAMLEEAIQQMEKRMPPAEDIFSRLSLLSPNTVLNQVEKGELTNLPFQHLINENVEGQYRKIGFVNWRNEPVLKNGIPSDAESFWFGVLQNSSSFNDLALYALTCLTTPVSNAYVERLFSLVTAVKTKPRNRMQVSLLDAIIRVRATQILSGKCCQHFSASHDMIELHNTSMYSSGSLHEASTSKETAPEPNELCEQQADGDESLMLFELD